MVERKVKARVEKEEAPVATPAPAPVTEIPAPRPKPDLAGIAVLLDRTAAALDDARNVTLTGITSQELREMARKLREQNV